MNLQCEIIRNCAISWRIGNIRVTNIMLLSTQHIFVVCVDHNSPIKIGDGEKVKFKTVP